MHSLPRSQEEIINDYIREWKKFFGKQLEVKITDEEFTPEFKLKAVELAFTDKGLIMNELKQEELEQEELEQKKGNCKVLTKKELEDKEKRRARREMQKIKKEIEDR